MIPRFFFKMRRNDCVQKNAISLIILNTTENHVFRT